MFHVNSNILKVTRIRLTIIQGTLFWSLFNINVASSGLLALMPTEYLTPLFPLRRFSTWFWRVCSTWRCWSICCSSTWRSLSDCSSWCWRASTRCTRATTSARMPSILFSSIALAIILALAYPTVLRRTGIQFCSKCVFVFQDQL